MCECRAARKERLYIHNLNGFDMTLAQKQDSLDVTFPEKIYLYICSNASTYVRIFDQAIGGQIALLSCFWPWKRAWGMLPTQRNVPSDA